MNMEEASMLDLQPEMKSSVLPSDDKGVDLNADRPAPFEMSNWTDENYTCACARVEESVPGIKHRKRRENSDGELEIFAEFEAAFPTSKRTKKAVGDKLQALREMYRFISNVNANRIAGSTSKPEWFEVSKKEKRELRNRHRIKSPNLSQYVYVEVCFFLSKQPDTEPLDSTYSAQSRFHADNNVSGNAAVDNDTNDWLGATTSKQTGNRENKDPQNTGRINSDESEQQIRRNERSAAR